MPKRIGKLWTAICSEDNIRSSISQVLARRRQKGHWGKQEQYIQDRFEDACRLIKRSLIERTYEFGKVHHFVVKERKKERVIDHLDTFHSIYLQCVMNVVQPIFIQKYIKTTYSSIKGRGLVQMSKHIKRVIQRNRDKAFLLVDMKKCYANVSHEAMMTALKRVFKDKYLIEFFERLIGQLPEGLAIGFSTNHYLVNLLFNNLDHRIEKMQGTYIFRYMDDILIIADKNNLPLVYKILEEETQKISQVIKPNTRFAPIDYGISFCGYKYFSDHIELKKDIVRSMYAKDRHLRKTKATDSEYKQGMASYWGWCKYCNATALFRSVLKDKTYLFEKQFEQMKRFSEIAEEADRHEQYEGEYWRKQDILNKEVEFLKFRKTKVRGKEKYIVQACINGTYGYFFTEAIGITDKLERYRLELPFAGTIKELTNKVGQQYLTIV